MDRISKFALLTAALVPSYLLFLPPIVGLANNGDFGVVLTTFDMLELDNQDPDRHFLYIVPTYRPVAERLTSAGLMTSEVVLIAPVYLLNRLLLSKDGLFDIRMAGMLHLGLFLGVLYLLTPLTGRSNPWARRALYLVLLGVFLDTQYVSWFNTLYPDAAALMAILYMTVLFLRLVWKCGDSFWNSAGFLAASAIFASSKAPHARTAVLVLILILILWRRGLFGTGRGWRVLWAMVALVGVSSWLLIWRTPRRYAYYPLYDVVFMALLPQAPDPVRSLQELGLDGSYLGYAGTWGFRSNSALATYEGLSDFMRRTSYSKLGLYYLRHPAEALRLWKIEMAQAGYGRPPEYGNFPKNIGYAPRTESTAFRLASFVRARVLAERPFAALAYLLLPAAFLLVWSWKVRTTAPGLFEGVCAFVSMALLEMAMNTLAASQDSTRHLFIYNTMADILFTGTLVVTAVAWLDRWESRRAGGRTAAAAE